MNQESLKPRRCAKSSLRGLGGKIFFHNCLITNDRKRVKGKTTPKS